MATFAKQAIPWSKSLTAYAAAHEERISPVRGPSLMASMYDDAHRFAGWWEQGAGCVGGLMNPLFVFIWKNTWGRIGGTIRLSAFGRVPIGLVIALLPFGLTSCVAAMATAPRSTAIGATFLVLGIVSFGLALLWLFFLMHGDLDY